MNCRSLAALGVTAVLFGAASLYAQDVRACGVERWPVKIAADLDAARVDTVPFETTVSQLALFLPPADIPARRRVAPEELRTYRVTARVVGIKREEDSDRHFILADTGNAGVTMIAELPDSQCALGSAHAARFAELSRVADTIRAPALVEVTGIGFFDFHHAQTGVAPNAFELHPIIWLRVVSNGPRSVATGPEVRRSRGLVGSDTVWVNTRSHVYHCRGSRWYGATRHGELMLESQAVARGNRAAYGRSCG